jgi:tetratricopeptide (TPR) repeat protein
MQDVIQRATESGDPGMAEQAIAEIDLRTQSSPSPLEKAELLLNKAVFLGILRRFEDARAELAGALGAAPDDPEISLQHDYIRAMLCHQAEEFQEALRRMNELLKDHAELLKTPKFRFVYEDVQQRRAFELFRLRRFEDAIVSLKECLMFDMPPKDRSVMLAHLGISYSELKNREAARAYLLQACTADLPEEWRGEVHFYLGLTYAHLNLLRESKEEFQLSERQLPVLKVYAWLSRVCGLLGEKEESQRYALLARPS